VEVKKSFGKASTSGGKDQPELELDPSMLTTFLVACMKLLQDSKAMKGLQELINRSIRTTPGEPRIIRKIGKHAMCTGREMRLTTQI